MSDNMTVTPGSGKTVATNEIDGVDYQEVKMAFGAKGAVTYVDDTNRLPVGGSAIGALNETAPAGDTDPAGLNGRLQRAAQLLTLLNTAIADMAVDIADLLAAFNTPVDDLPRERLYETSQYIAVPFDENTAAAHVLVAATSDGSTHRLHGLTLTAGDDVVATLSGNTTVGAIPLQFGQGIDWKRHGDPYYVSDPDTALTITLSGAVRVSGVAWISTSIPA